MKINKRELMYMVTRFLPDKLALKVMYRITMKQKLNLSNPVTMNEKLQWLKLYNREITYSQLVDKYEVREYISEILGKEYLIPLVGCYEKYDDIDFSTLPDKFVMKCNHDSGSVSVINEKKSIDHKLLRRFYKKKLNDSYYKRYREWPYKHVKPRILIEKHMDENGNGIPDYKFYCFNGRAECVLVCVDREIGDTKFYFFNKEWQLLRYNKRGIEAPADFTLPKPNNIDTMFEFAEKLSKDIPFVRVDLYEVDGKIYFGEMTFFPNTGMDPNRAREIDIMFGNMIDIEKIKKKGSYSK